MLIRLLTLSAKKGCKGMDLFDFDYHRNEKNLRYFTARFLFIVFNHWFCVLYL